MTISDLGNPGDQDGKPGTLTPRQRTFIEALLVQGEVMAAANQASVPRSTAYRWFQQPTFASALREAEREALMATARRMSRLGVKAVKVLDDVLDDADVPVAVRVRAAEAVLTKLLTLREAVDLEDRLSRVEALLEERP